MTMRMMVEFAESPPAIATRTPRFAWEVPLLGRGRRQSAYRILVATREDLLEPGRDDVVWTLANSTGYPSWGYMLRGGKTTSCERWDGERGSLNHAPLGAAVDEWFYRGLAGIRADESAPGFERVVFRPYMPADLRWARAPLMTVRGTVASEWHRDGGSARLCVTIPANSSGTVYVPTGDAERITEGPRGLDGAEGVSLLRVEDGRAVLEVGSGTYVFKFPAA